METTRIMRLSRAGRITVWHVHHHKADAVLAALLEGQMISRATSDLNVSQGADMLSIVSVKDGDTPQQWEVHSGVEAIHDLIPGPPVIDLVDGLPTPAA